MLKPVANSFMLFLHTGMYEIVSSAHLAQYLAFFRVCSFNSLEGFPRTHRREAADVVLMLEEPGRILVVEGYCNQYIYI